MSLLTPWALLALLPAAALAFAYVLTQRRRQRYAVRFAALPMLDRLIPRRPTWRRHVPAGLVLLAMAALCLAAARPEVLVRVPQERATVMVAIDTSGSMAATDVEPSRLGSATRAAQQFIDQLPETMNVGVVTFAGSSSVVAAPTTDHAAVQAQLQTLREGTGGTAIGDAVLASLEQVRALAARDEAESVPARLVVLSDGANTSGSPLQQAAAAATAADIPVSTIAFGTPDGVLPGGERVPVETEAMAALAEDTGGATYSAESAQELTEVYSDIGSSIGWDLQPREITAYLAAVGLALAMGAAALSLRWSPRLL
ncbi:VWA domain-containing protein [Quadrisphaera sp. KR29]|uniref:VWA domain-containing protein n=1 Tax=Quadrisphaera sp. KR29 TaxID=3461391 RepID=UPI004043BD56